MRLSALILVTLLSTSIATQAQEHIKKFKTTLAATKLYREDFRWSIAGVYNGESINILSELRWKNLNGPQLQTNFQYEFNNSIILKCNLSGTLITDGEVTDTDFGKSNRQDTLYFDSFDSDKGSMASIDLAIGYKLKLLKKFAVTPFAGYNFDMQSLYILRDIENIKSTYTTRWRGVIIGFDTKIPILKRFLVQPKLVYKQVSYSAKANWDQIPEFMHPVSFKHKAKGFGIEPGVSFNYMINDTISLLVDGKYSYWTTGNGSDTVYYADGTTATTQLNHIIRNSRSLIFGVEISF